MNQIAISIAVLYWLAVTAIAIGVYAVIRTRRRSHPSQAACEARIAHIEASFHALRGELEAGATQARNAGAAAATPPLPGPALNLTKRSQALRMYRRGEDPDHIAAALSVPHQEIDLLLKVHRIVIGEL